MMKVGGGGLGRDRRLMRGVGGRVGGGKAGVVPGRGQGLLLLLGSKIASFVHGWSWYRFMYL